MAFDLQIGAATLFMEASGEPPEGQQAVASVLGNRLRDGRWGPTLAAVCLAPAQFSCWNTSDPNRKRLAATSDTVLLPFEAMIQRALDGVLIDNTNGSLWYFNPGLVLPSWAALYRLQANIGAQAYYSQS
jgi:N-acetylmuramoyl-L-alanine amidase